MSRTSSPGFTLTELLVAMAIIAVLVLLAVPIQQRIAEQNNTVKCLHRLRSIGTILLDATREQQQPVRFWYNGSTGMMWNTMLVVKGYATHDVLRQLSCPNIEYAAPNGSVSGRHYGVFAGDPHGRLETLTEGGAVGNTYALNLRTHPQPGSALFLVDSATAAKAPSIRAYPGGVGLPSVTAGGIHLRHQGKANLLFLDGHLELSSPNRLRELGVQQVLDEGFQIQSR